MKSPLVRASRGHQLSCNNSFYILESDNNFPKNCNNISLNVVGTGLAKPYFYFAFVLNLF